MLEPFKALINLLITISKGCFESGFWYIPAGVILVLIIGFFKRPKG